MKRVTLVPMLTLIFMLIIVSDSPCQNDLTIATFNCEFLTRPKVHVKFGEKLNLEGAASDKWDQPGFRDQKFAEAAVAVASVIAGLDADVIALTEVGDETDVTELMAEIANQGLTYDHHEVGISTDNTTKQNVAVLSKFPIIDKLQHIPGRESYLQEEDDPETEHDTGISKGMRVTIQAPGISFQLYVLHLASESGGNEKDQQRIAQASIVRRHYLPALRAGTHIIVAGDLNDRRGQPTLKRIRGFDDIDEDLMQTGLADYFEDNELDTRWTYVYQGQRQQIDHVLVSRSWRDETDSITAETIAHGNDLASDHNPFRLTLEIP